MFKCFFFSNNSVYASLLILNTNCLIRGMEMEKVSLLFFFITIYRRVIFYNQYLIVNRLFYTKYQTFEM